MLKQKWLLLIAVGITAGVTIIAIPFIVWFVRLNNIGADPALPIYTYQQSPSSHPGYRHTTVSSGTKVYVNDYDEYALYLANATPTHVVGRTRFGDGKIFEIAGQSPSAYIAVDVGSEMEAYAVFRNSQLLPFNWHSARFQSMKFIGPPGSGINKQTTDPALIADVLRALKDRAPTHPITPVSASTSNLANLKLFSNQLPGLIYEPSIYLDKSNSVYLAENIAVTTTRSETRFQAIWKPAGAVFAKWVKTP